MTRPRSARPASLLLGAALMTGGLMGVAAPAVAVSSDDGTLCVDYDSLAEAQAAVDAGQLDTSNLDRDGDGRACEEEELPRAGVVCPPVEVSDLYGLLPGECEGDWPADPDRRDEMPMPVGGVDAGSGDAAGDHDLVLLGGGLVLGGAAGLVLVSRRRA